MKKYIIFALVVLILAVITGAGTLKFRNTSNTTSDAVVRVYSKAGGEVTAMAVDTAGNVEFDKNVTVTQDLTVTGTCTGCVSTGIENPFLDLLVVSPTVATAPVLTLKSAAGNTDSLFEATDSTNAVLALISASGSGAFKGVQLTETTAAPSCGIATRGLIWHTKGGAGVADDVQVCTKDAGDAYAWRTIY
jgi:hypothetical protein